MKKTICGCVVIMLLTNNLMLSENDSEELIKLQQERVEQLANYWSNIGDL